MTIPPISKNCPFYSILIFFSLRGFLSFPWMKRKDHNSLTHLFYSFIQFNWKSTTSLTFYDRSPLLLSLTVNVETETQTAKVFPLTTLPPGATPCSPEHLLILHWVPLPEDWLTDEPNYLSGYTTHNTAVLVLHVATSCKLPSTWTLLLS